MEAVPRTCVRLALALLVALAAVQLLAVRPAAAATSVTFSPRTLSATPAHDGAGHHVVNLGSVSWTFVAGQTAYVVSVFRVNSSTYRMLVDNEVRCTGPGGWTKNMVVGQNIYAAGGAPWDNIQLTTRYLVHPGAAGAVTCTAYSRTVSLRDFAGDTVRLASGSLRFADLDVDNTTAGTPIQASVARAGVPVTSTSPIAREPTTGMFDLAPGHTGLSVFGDTEFAVNCAPGTPCGMADTTRARFTLFINQWNAAGTVLCKSDSSATVTGTWSYSVHHVYVPLNKPNFEISTAPGCAPKFNAYVRVDWLAGVLGHVQGVASPLYDGDGETGPTHASDMSHIFAVPY